MVIEQSHRPDTGALDAVPFRPDPGLMASLEGDARTVRRLQKEAKRSLAAAVDSAA